MGKAQKKTGKGRLDKYYKLAKEQGYRARSAFKLIQLNKKYSFLETARCCIDLCAAPGGWLQVASKFMPVNSVIVGTAITDVVLLAGVDLVPIKPIPRVVTFAADITTAQCRNQLRNELKDWKADVVLHDGAPNVGTAWIQDAYSQSELVLMSLKLAVEFLIKGGTFVTKVFRSTDYNNLIWVFSQLFGKVEATKPPSSRNVSAEIFVVCRDFLAPKHIDPKFLDPRHVFKDLAASIPNGADKGSSANNLQANVFQPEKRRRKRDGYEDGNVTLFKKTGAAEFIKTQDPIAVLGSVNRITFETDEEKEWTAMDITNDDVKTNCDDLKVLGKSDFKTLLKWRLALREEIGLDVNAKPAEEYTETAEIVEEVDEEQQIQEELERLNAEAAARAKRERRRANELKTKTIQRMQLQMTAPLDIGLEQQDASLGGQDDLFDLGMAEKKLRARQGLSIAMGTHGEDATEDEDSDAQESEGGECETEDDDLDPVESQEKKAAKLEADLDGLYNAYLDRLREHDAKFKVQEARRSDKMRDSWGGIQKKGSDDEDGDGESEEESERHGWDAIEQAKFDDADSNSSDDSDAEDGAPPIKRQRLADGSGKERHLVTPLNDRKPAGDQAAKIWFSQDIFGIMGDLDNVTDGEEEAEEDEEDGSDDQFSQSVVDGDAFGDDDDDGDNFEVVPQEPEDEEEMWDVVNQDEDYVRQKKIDNLGLKTAEAVTLAQLLVNRQKTKNDLINDGFNRYSLNSKEGLPSWFLDDEKEHYRPNIPVTKEAIQALRVKQRALDARPIKKVAEAKARKKMKAAQRVEKAMKKAEGVNATSDMSEREKAQQIEKLMRKGLSSGSKKKKEVKVVVAKGAHKGIKGRPKGVKGRYTMVDARMKKEVRAKKRVEKANKKRKRS
ncbi:hypothetical protein FISHEDRAFT_46112 [Fistulina hepatica ATCC 64428]|uniref:Uncharacterized protein n=1 Tax=Fistulina hepatica ATCC 64428 TaxID=1128425 RepID=A0A0D7A8J8_9AGAR|nr:hypothetical protein FISHEDRAFT_46112 [Fistulina hepatica ATCC 64428]